VRALEENLSAADEVARDGAGVKAEEVFDLSAGDEDGDAVGEADDDGARNEFDGGAKASDAEEDEEHAGHEGADQQSVEAVAGQDAEDDDDEGAGGAADLIAGAAEGGDGESRDDSGVEAGFGRRSGGDGEGHRERKSDEADGNAGGEVCGEFLGAVVAQRLDGFRCPVGEGHRYTLPFPVEYFAESV
jgi:hypothetical protein